MSYVDEEKRAFCISYIIEYLNTLDTNEKFIAFVNGVTPDKIKTKLKQAFQNAQVEGDGTIASAQEKQANDVEMVSEIDSW